MKVFALCALAVAAYAVDVSEMRLINDQAFVDKINSNPGLLWKAGMNERFDNTPLSEMKSLTGVTAESWGAVQRMPRADFSFINDTAIPDSFDSETNWPKCAKVIGDIRDQSNCGCCWAFAGAEAASDRLCVATDGKAQVPLSAESLCFCASEDGCDGGDILTPWQFIKDEGLPTGGQYKGSGPFGAGLCADFTLPHCHHHGPQGSDPYPAEGAPGCPSESSPAGPKACDSGSKLTFAQDKYSYNGQTVTANGAAEIQKAIMAGGPMEVAFTVYSDFENYVSGIYHHVSGGQVGGHAVKVVGWGVDSGTKYWKIANSWNPYWGEKGYFRIKRGNNEGGIEDQAIASAPDAKWSRAGDSTLVV